MMRTYTSTDLFNKDNLLVYSETDGEKIGEIEQTEAGFTAITIRNKSASFLKQKTCIDFLIRSYEKVYRAKQQNQDINQTSLFF